MQEERIFLRNFGRERDGVGSQSAFGWGSPQAVLRDNSAIAVVRSCATCSSFTS